ncbi:hypothetical protein ONZ45_g14777 [Pleurotus djamor]|nr:hypothetical protein ONZ45_g14777 [Pleurotus djamor]
MLRYDSPSPPLLAHLSLFPLSFSLLPSYFFPLLRSTPLSNVATPPFMPPFESLRPSSIPPSPAFDAFGSQELQETFRDTQETQETPPNKPILPSNQPTNQPSFRPSNQPTNQPTTNATVHPV